MNYYVLPKTKYIDVKIQLCYNTTIEPYLSPSEIVRDGNVEALADPLEYMRLIVGPTMIESSSNTIFELMELFQVFRIPKPKCVYYAMQHSEATQRFLSMFFQDESIATTSGDAKADLFLCEFSAEDYAVPQRYIDHTLTIVCKLLKQQAAQGTAILKLDAIMYKPVVDVLYLLSGLYHKLYLVKPSISNLATGERYLICKGFHSANIPNTDTLQQLCKKDEMVTSVLDNPLPYYLVNRLEEMNLMIRKQQVEVYDQVLQLQGEDNKVEQWKKRQLQKGIQWCEKYQLPHNKFIFRSNIFSNK